MTSALFTDSDFAEFIDDISAPFMSGQIARWRARIRLPFSMVTGAGPVTLKSDGDIVRNFRLYLEAVKAMGLNFVHREPLGVEHCEDGTVLATYRTHLMRNGTRMVDPYTSTALLHPDPEGWRMSAILNARGHHDWTGRPPKDTGE
ncbi:MULTISPECIES: hypothetical protein [Mameliella]|uniref:SnoaL-like domain-containing protein n=1 Tax=Mameliella alba TaxID=561184 RepID=A0A0B3RGM6_9RHOB|nr:MULTISPECIES: hypothetical protein [Mameliella]MCR9275505.1 hypothetical protein [Paracoccaceae bacterium]ODM48030.1 hypothetical protein A9320_20845 [Ruegeria sp. PBVC088]KHQ50460.1 hypothetical protein OA50_04968 [Mameliella alba]MBY6122484.1 hypothetical protein [Mameliella alba]MDD9731782.1 hypothetical protein [Mameliella sp. AT18]